MNNNCLCNHGLPKNVCYVYKCFSLSCMHNYLGETHKNWNKSMQWAFLTKYLSSMFWKHHTSNSNCLLHFLLLEYGKNSHNFALERNIIQGLKVQNFQENLFTGLEVGSNQNHRKHDKTKNHFWKYRCEVNCEYYPNNFVIFLKKRLQPILMESEEWCGHHKVVLKTIKRVKPCGWKMLHFCHESQ